MPNNYAKFYRVSKVGFLAWLGIPRDRYWPLVVRVANSKFGVKCDREKDLVDGKDVSPLTQLPITNYQLPITTRQLK